MPCQERKHRRVLPWFGIAAAAGATFAFFAMSSSAPVAQIESDQPQEVERLVRDLETILDRWRNIAAHQPGLVVTGYIAGAVSQQREGPQFQTVYVPRVEVVVEEISGATSAPEVTDLSGRFTFRNVRPGKYSLCWKRDGFTPGCRSFDVAGANVHLSDVTIFPERSDQAAVVHGHVRLADGSKPRLLEPLIGVNAYARVELLDAGRRPLATAVVNNFGQYVLPQVPSRTEIILRASIEGVSSEQPVMPEAQFHLARTHRVDLTFPNSRPKLQPIAASDGSARRLKTARPGSSVQIVAQAVDPDGDTLTYAWQLASGAGTLNATTGNQVRAIERRISQVSLS